LLALVDHQFAAPLASAVTEPIDPTTLEPGRAGGCLIADAGALMIEQGVYECAVCVVAA
jgi:hypothetical protein